jgi:hypothetical protein
MARDPVTAKFELRQSPSCFAVRVVEASIACLYVCMSVAVFLRPAPPPREKATEFRQALCGLVPEWGRDTVCMAI